MRLFEYTHPGWGIAVVRIAMGIVLMVAGYSKFAGGIDGFAGFVDQVGAPAPGVVAALIAAVELVGGLLILIGLGVRWLGVWFLLQFLYIAFGFKLADAGWDATRVDLMLIAASAMLILAGAGKASVEERLTSRTREPVRV